MSNIQMKSARQKECDISDSLFAVAIPVWYESSGKVSPQWLSACEEQRQQTKDLMEAIVDPLNLEEACKRVVRNAGKGGVDGMQVGELRKCLQENLQTIQDELLDCKYKAEAVRGVQIRKPKGTGYRQLGIPTVRDRLVQQAIAQQLQKWYDPSFSENSYGFRPKRNAHQALSKAAKYVTEGKRHVVDIDLENFFDEVNHHRLMWLLSTRISDKRVLWIIKEFLKSGILQDGLMQQRTKGTPQGSPLSPLLSNIVLDELDQELNRREISYVRYADDMQIFVGSKTSAERVMRSITKFIEGRMKLKVNRSKSAIRKYYETNFLGHSILNQGRVGLSRESEAKLKSKVKKITRRNRGVSFDRVLHELRPVLQGWLNYFKYASMQKKLKVIDGWLRRRLKCFRLRQCKRCIGIVRWLRKLGVEETLCWRTALSGKGWWRLSNSPALNIGMNNDWFAVHGYYSLALHHEKLHRKIL
ncbi:MAG: group II intron reverse transcriptase/maturase [Saprospiraceae bacterium]